MDRGITHRPSFATVGVALDAGERVRAEAGAMVSYGDDIEMETNATGEFLNAPA